MKTRMKKVKITAVFIFSVMLAVFLPAVSVRAADIQSYSVTGTYRQTDARTMLAMINSFRTGTEAWQWNESNAQQVQITGLQGLRYDYNLEQIAMQRAMELVVAYSHTRPNGEEFSTAYTGSYSVIGENIAIGTGNMTAADAFELWKETNQPYAGQGHRRNMLNRRYGAVGISHVYYNGCHYWVQELADTVVSAAYTAPNDQTATVEVAVSSDLNPTLTYTANPSSYEMIPGEIRSLPTVTAELRTSATWNFAPSASVPLTEDYVWTVQDKSYGFVTGTYQFAAMKAGHTSLVTTIGGQTITVPVTISNNSNNNNNNNNNNGGNNGDNDNSRVDLSTATIRLAQDSYVYDGSAKTPAVTLSLNGYTLRENTDYTVVYSNNISEGTALVTVTGIGNYIGSACTTFTITRPLTDLSRAQITLAQNSYVYDGYAKTPAVTVSLNGYTLRANTDYTVMYFNNSSVGTAWVTVTGIGSYSGTAYATFTITGQQSFDLSHAQITLAQNSYVYDGYAKTPAVTVTLNGYTLKQNTDYTVMYSNNIYAGTARVTVFGTNNYTGIANATFTITKPITDLSTALVALLENSYVYDGYAKTPAVTVMLNGSILKLNTDYTLSYSQNVDAGTAYVTIAGINNYTGSITKDFVITKAQNTVKLKKSNYYLNYSTKAQTVTLGVTKTAGTIKYSSNNSKVKVKAGKVTIAKKFTGTAVITIKVTDKNYKTVTKKVKIYVY